MAELKKIADLEEEPQRVGDLEDQGRPWGQSILGDVGQKGAQEAMSAEEPKKVAELETQETEQSSPVRQSILGPGVKQEAQDRALEQSQEPTKLAEIEPDEPEWVTKQKQGIEQPWIDPVDAVAGPLGFTRKVGAKAAGKAVGGSLAAEPVVGGVQGKVEEETKELPDPAKIPVNFLTGMVMGDLLGHGAKQASKLKAARPKPGQVSKSKVLKDAALQDKDTGIDLTEQLPSIEKALSQKGAEKVGELYTKHVGSPVWDQLVMKHIPKLLEKVPGGKAVNRAAIYGYKGDLPETKEYMQLRERMEQDIGLGTEYAIDLGNRLQKLPQDKQMRVGEYIRGELDQLPDDVQDLGSEAKDALYRLGREAVDTGLLDEDTFFKNAGKYMPRLYTSKEYKQKLDKYGLKKPERLDLSRFQRRKDIPKEVRKEMGEILTPGYPVAKGVAQLANDVQRSKFFNAIAKNPDWARPAKVKKIKNKGKTAKKRIEPQDVPENFKKLSETEKLGKLSGAYVHPEIHAELEDVAKSISKSEKAWNKALGSWKFGKVILSPKTHMRNVMSNSILAHIGGLPMTSQPRYLKEAAKELSKGGEYWKLGKKHGLLDSSFVQKEMGQLFDRVNQQLEGVKANTLQDSVGALGRGVQGLKKGGRKAADLYQAEEQWFKMAKMMHNMEKKGMDPETAAKDAEKWMFNYGKLTPFQDKYRRHPFGAPFSTFSFKALPRVAEAATKYPWRFAAPLAVISGIQEAAQQEVGDTDKQRKAKRKLLPEWMQGGTGEAMPNFTRVPVTDDHGREYYLNLTYILPWGDIGEGGGFMGIPGSLRPMSQPFTNELAQQISNYDSFWEQNIVKDEDLAGLEGADKVKEEAKQRGRHFYETMAPTLAMDVEKILAATKGEPDYRGRERPGGVTAADVFGGIKMYPVDYSERVSRLINEYSPKAGTLARRINTDIRTLATKRESALEQGKEDLAQEYQEQIDKRIEKLQGLAEQTQKIGKTYKEATGQ